jgi:hypothetical protein
MLQQVFNTILNSSNIMLGVIIILGVIVIYKFIGILLRIYNMQQAKDEPVYKNMIKKSEEIKHLQ